MKKAWRKRLIPRRCAAGTLWQTVGQAVHGMQGEEGCFTQGEPAVLAPPATEKKHALRQAHSAHKRTYSCRKLRPSKKEGNAIPNPNGARTCRKLRPPNRAKTLPKPRARGESIEPGTAFSKRGKALPPRAHARKRVLPIRPSASCLWGISCVPEARPLQDVNRVSMIHLAT